MNIELAKQTPQLKGEAKLRAELAKAWHDIESLPVIELAVRNPSVKDYMHHWGGRALKAEAEVERKSEAIQKLWKERDAAQAEVERLKLQAVLLEDAKKDREYAEAYFKQAERMLTSNEQTLLAELAAEQAKVRELVEVLKEIVQVMGPDVPECSGCEYEWKMAIDALQDKLEPKT